MIRYLFDLSGNWIAFGEGKYLFNTECEWIGWFPDRDIAVDMDGNYLGTIYLGNRLLYNYLQPMMPFPGFPGFPSHPSFPGYPGYAGYAGYIPNTADVEIKRLKRG